MDYRMYKGPVPAGKNVVSLIKEFLKKENITISTPLRFIGFEGDEGVEFTLNKQKEKIIIPSSGKFITPFDGERYMPVYSLVFEKSFSGNIYYII